MAGIKLAQSIKMTNDTLQAGVIEILATESKLLHLLPFMTIQGSGYTYNVEKNLGSAQFRQLNGNYTNKAIETETMVEALVILGDEAIIDTFQMAVHSDVNNLMAIEVALRSKAIAHMYEKCFLRGGVTGGQGAAWDGNETFQAGSGTVSESQGSEFVGLLTRYIFNNTSPSSNTVAEVMSKQVIMASNESPDLIGDIDVLLDMVAGGADCLIMNKKTRRALTAKARPLCTYRQSEFGVQFTQYGGIDIVDVESDILGDDYVLAVKFGAKEGVCGLQNGGVRVTALGEMESQPQLKTRIEWFCGLAVFNPKTVAIRKPYKG